MSETTSLSKNCKKTPTAIGVSEIKTNMMLIIFLGIIVKLAFVSGDCDVGTQEVNDFNFTRATGTWYVLLHNPDVFESKLECVVFNFGLPQGNISLITIQAHDISEKRHVTFNGIATNWTNTGLEEIYPPPSIWSGRYYIISIDYDRFCIHKFCSIELNEMYVHVSFRSQHPKKDTVERVLKELQENNIDVNQLVPWKADHCQQAESSAERGSSE